MSRRVTVSIAVLLAPVLLALFALPAAAAAVRPATEQEVAEFTAVAKAREQEKIECGTLLRAHAVASDESCLPPTRPGYEPTVTSARVSTLDETWALAYVAPVPRSLESATVIFHAEQGAWRLGAHGNDCSLGQSIGRYEHGTDVALMPDLVVSMGCTPIIPVKVRCLDIRRISLLAIPKPRQCAVSGPQDSPFPEWMNVREVHWHHWGAEQGAWGLGVIREVPAGLTLPPGNTGPGPGLSVAAIVGPPTVRLVPTGLVDCGTAYFYSQLRVISPFARFTVTLPTCPDVFFGPGP